MFIIMMLMICIDDKTTKQITIIIIFIKSWKKTIFRVPVVIQTSLRALHNSNWFDLDVHQCTLNILDGRTMMLLYIFFQCEWKPFSECLNTIDYMVKRVNKFNMQKYFVLWIKHLRFPWIWLKKICTFARNHVLKFQILLKRIAFLMRFQWNSRGWTKNIGLAINIRARACQKHTKFIRK